MKWSEKLADKMLDKFLYPGIERNHLIGVPLKFDEVEKVKIKKFSKNFIMFVLTIGEYISYMIIAFYFLNKVGFNKTILILLVMIIVRLGFVLDSLGG